MRLHLSLGVAVLGFAIAACGSSSGGSSASSAGTSAGSTSTGTAPGSSGTTTGLATSSGGAATSSGGGTTGSSSAGSSWLVSTFVAGTPAGGGCGAFGADNVFSPLFLGIDSSENVYVTDANVDKITPAKALSVVSGIYNKYLPNGFTVDGSGNSFYSIVTPFGENTEIYSAASNSTVYAQSNGPSCTDTGSGTPGIGIASGIAVDSSGNFFVADSNCYKVREIAADGTISTIAGTGMQGFVQGAADVAQFSQLSSIAIDSNGNLYVAESDYADIREVQPDGTTSELSNAADSVGGIAVAADGTVYFTDDQLNYVKRVDPGTHATTIIAGTGAIGFQNGAGPQATFNEPAGIAVDPVSGSLFVADTGNCAIRMLTPPTP